MPNTLTMMMQRMVITCQRSAGPPTPHAAQHPVLPRPKPKWG
jgi:hypothetical protein